MISPYGLLSSKNIVVTFLAAPAPEAFLAFSATHGRVVTAVPVRVSDKAIFEDSIAGFSVEGKRVFETVRTAYQEDSPDLVLQIAATAQSRVRSTLEVRYRRSTSTCTVRHVRGLGLSCKYHYHEACCVRVETSAQ